MLELILHWNPSLKKSINNHNAWISNYCPICKYHNKNGRHFRYNVKLKVAKCYNCGLAFKNTYWFIYQLKNGIQHKSLFDNKEYLLEGYKDKLSTEGCRFEKIVGCETLEENQLPF